MNTNLFHLGVPVSFVHVASYITPKINGIDYAGAALLYQKGL